MENIDKIIFNRIDEYLKLMKRPYKKIGNSIALQCVCCQPKALTAQTIPNSYKIKCHRCNKNYSLITIVRKLEPDKEKNTVEEITEYLKQLFKISILSNKEKEDATTVFNFYKENGFSLVPIRKNDKIPIEIEWTSKEHKEIEEWLAWADSGLNVGIRTGCVSGITIIDLDTKEIPEELKKVLTFDTAYQESTKGYHFIYKYEVDLPKTRISDYKIDVENDGGQVVCYPSIINGIQRKMTLKPIQKMPDALKDFIKSKTTSIPIKTESEQIREVIQNNTYKVPLLNEGDGRNDFFMHFGGRIRQFVSSDNASKVLHVLDNIICEPRLGSEIDRTIMQSINKYNFFDDKELANEVVNYLRDVEFARRDEIIRQMGIDSKRLAKVLNYLVKENVVVKRGYTYAVMQKMQWQTDLIDAYKPIPFKMPYFNDLANFSYGDVLILGAGTGVGKCITEGLLATNQGLIDIKDYGERKIEGVSKVAKHIRLSTGFKKHKTCRSTNYFYKEKVNNTIKIKTYFGFELEGTPEHPILVTEKNIKDRKNKLIVGNRIYSKVSGISKKFKKLQDLKENDEVIISAPHIFAKKAIHSNINFTFKKSKYANGLKEVKIPKKIDYNVGKLIGYIIGEGNFNNNSLDISQGVTEEKNINTIISLISELGTTAKIYKDKRNDNVRIRISSAILTRFFRLKALGIRNYKLNILSPNREIPSCIMRAKEETQRGFIEGLFDGEGYFSKEKKYLSICMASEKLIKQLQIMLLNYGIVARRIPKKIKEYPDNIYHTLILSQEMTYKFSKIFNLNKITIEIPKYTQRTAHLKKLYNNQFTESGIFVDRIISIEVKNEEKYVYDFNIENSKYKENNSFWSNGFISHNTHIAMNIAKRFSDQGVVTHYLSREPGSRFKKIALTLGLKEGDFKHIKCYDPTVVDFEKNSITIIDWLLPQDYAKTDKIFEQMTERIDKAQGILIVFVQLRKDNTWFAPDLIEFFPALSAKYVYDKDSDGTFGSFEIHKIREGKIINKNVKKIPCRYNWESKVLSRIDEIDEKENKERIKNEKVEN